MNIAVPFSKRWYGFLVAIVLLSMAVTSFAAWHRLPWTDEGVFSCAAFNLAHHGFFGTTVLDPDGNNLPRIDQRTYWIVPGYLLFETAFYKIAPASIFWSRLLNTLLTPFIAWAAYRAVTGLLNDSLTAILAAGFLVLSYNYLWATSWARPENLCLLLGLGAMAVYLYWRELHFERAILVSQTLVCLSGLVHPNGLLHFLGLGLIVLVLDRHRIRLTTMLLAAVPYAVFGGAYLLYIMQDPSAFALQMKTNGLNNGRFAHTLNPFLLIWTESRERYFRAYGLLSDSALSRAKVIMLLAYAGAILSAVLWRPVRTMPGIKLILALTALYFSVQCVFNQKLTIYLVHIDLFFATLLAAFLAQAWRLYPRMRPLVLTLTVGLLLFQAAGIVAMSSLRSYSESRGNVVKAIRDNSANATWIDASTSFWFSLDADTRLKYDPTLGLINGRWPGLIVLDQFSDETWEGMATSQPARYSAIKARLMRYRKVYDRDGYRVYLLAT